MNPKKPYILVADDMSYNLEILKISLAELDAKIDFVDSGMQVIELAQKDIPDLIILDIIMPEVDGFEVCEALKNNPLTKDVPIIFLSSLEGVDDKVRAFELGGVDFITKPFSPLEVAIRVDTHLRHYRMIESVNTLLAEYHHTLNAPLTLIKNSVSLQESEFGKNEQTQNIKSAADSLDNVCKEIFSAIKKEINSK